MDSQLEALVESPFWRAPRWIAPFFRDHRGQQAAIATDMLPMLEEEASKRVAETQFKSNGIRPAQTCANREDGEPRCHGKATEEGGVSLVPSVQSFLTLRDVSPRSAAGRVFPFQRDNRVGAELMLRPPNRQFHLWRRCPTGLLEVSDRARGLNANTFAACASRPDFADEFDGDGTHLHIVKSNITCAAGVKTETRPARKQRTWRP